MFQFLKRWMGSYTAYQPGTGRIVPVNSHVTSGINVNEQTAMTIPALFHALRMYAQTTGYLSWDLIHDLGKQGQEIERNHAVHHLIHDAPNELQTPSAWRELMVWQSISYGNGYSYIERNGNFRPTSLIPLLPDRTRPQLIDGRLVYQTVVNGKEIDLEPYEVFHLRGFSMNAVAGWPLVRLMADTLGLTKAQEEFAAKFFGAGCNMSAVVSMPGALSDKARQNLKDSMSREYGGLGNAFKTLFLEDGVKYERTSIAPEEAQFIEGRQFQLSEIARVTGLAPHLLFDLTRSTNNNIEHQGIEAVTYSFGPVANRLCEEANAKLLYESEKGAYFTRIDLTKLMQGDAQSQAQVDKSNFDMLALTPNERRAKIGLNPIEGGDQLFLNTAYLPLAVAVKRAMADIAVNEAAVTDPEDKQEIEDAETEGVKTPDENAPADGSSDATDAGPAPTTDTSLIDEDLARTALRPVVAEAVGRIIRRESMAVEKAAQKHTGDALTRWYGDWEQQQRDHIASVLQPVADAMTAMKLPYDAAYAARHVADSRADFDAGDIPEMLKRWQGERIEKSVHTILRGTHEAN